MSSNNIVMPPVQPPSSTASNREDDESGTSTPSLMMVSPDDIFLERLSERFGNHPCVEVRAASNGGYSSNTTAPVSSEDTSTPEVVADQPSKECGDTPSKLPHHCFRIKHYGRTVTYDVRDFVSRNRDALDRELSQAMYECDHPILKVLFPEGKQS